MARIYDKDIWQGYMAKLKITSGQVDGLVKGQSISYHKPDGILTSAWVSSKPGVLCCFM